MSKFNKGIKALLSQAIDYFDVTVLSKIDLTTKGDQIVYVDPLGNKTQPRPTDSGHNTYFIHDPENKFRQEINFQNGSPQQGVNGVSNEAIISVVLHRLTMQNESFPSAYNVLSIYLLQGALASLHSRVRDRKEFGIYDTDQVDPEDDSDMVTSKNLSLINAVGLLTNIIFKFDVAYGLNQPAKIHSMLDQLIGTTNEDKVEEGLNVISAFSFLSGAAIGSGIIRSIISIGTQFVKTQQEIAKGTGDGKEATEDTTTNNPV